MKRKYRFIFNNDSKYNYLQSPQNFFQYLPAVTNEVKNVMTPFQDNEITFIDLVEIHERLNIDIFKKIVYLQSSAGEKSNVIIQVLKNNCYDFYGNDFDCSQAKVVK